MPTQNLPQFRAGEPLRRQLSATVMNRLAALARSGHPQLSDQEYIEGPDGWAIVPKKQRRGGRRGAGITTLRLKEDPDFDAEAPTVILRGGNFSGKNVDTEAIAVVDNNVRYVFGYLKFNYAGKAELATLAIIIGTEDPDDPARQNDFPEYADGASFTGEAWYYIGKFWREEIPDTTPEQYEVKKANAHPGGNVLFEYGCDGNIRWGVQP